MSHFLDFKDVEPGRALPQAEPLAEFDCQLTVSSIDLDLRPVVFLYLCLIDIEVREDPLHIVALFQFIH